MIALGDRLDAAVRARLEAARTAEAYCPAPWVLGTDQVIDDDGDTVVAAHRDVVAHIALNDPARVVRDCERDLRVLERHGLVDVRVDLDRRGACAHAWADGDGWVEPWPCDEITWMAEAYGVDIEEDE